MRTGRSSCVLRTQASSHSTSVGHTRAHMPPMMFSLRMVCAELPTFVAGMVTDAGVSTRGAAPTLFPESIVTTEPPGVPDTVTVPDAGPRTFDASKATEKKFGQVDDHLGKAQRELRQQLLDVHKKLSDELERSAQEQQARLARESSELRSDKLDRHALAAMFTELAMRLTSDTAHDDEE